MKTIGLFISQPYCSSQSCNGVIKALSSKYNFKLFTKQKVEDNFFKDIDAVCFPGGFGDSDSFEHLMKQNKQSVVNFVKSGGVYIGICMGGYWASYEYFNLLEECKTVQYIKRPLTDTKRPHAKNIDVNWNGTPEKLFFYDGFTVVGNENKFQTYSRYMNGDPMAIIQKNIGLIACHPEADEFWYNSYSWLRGKYKSKHDLLVEFVDKVFNQ